MQTNTLQALKVVLLLVSAPLPITAQSWQTVLDFQFASGQPATGNVLAAGILGDVFCGGYADDAAGTEHGLVLRTDTSSLNWLLSDDTNLSPAQDGSRVRHGLGFDSNGNLYSVGSLTPKCPSCAASWLVRKSSDGGASWSTVDLFQYTPGMDATAQGFAADSSGNIYVVGFGAGPGSKTYPENLHWLVRKSSNGGQTWTLVDDVYSSLNRGFPKWGMPIRAHYASGLGLFVVGQTSSSENGIPQVWTVRRSLDAGATWSTVDSYQAAQGDNADANAVSHDNQGNIYVAGSVVVSQTIKHKTYTSTQWLVRKSSDGGNTWANLDVLAPGTSQIAEARGIGRDSVGNMVVVGRCEDVQGVFHWLVRRPDLLGYWHTVDDFNLGSSNYAEADDIVSDAAGNLLVTGEADDPTPGVGGHWIVRRF